MPYIENLDEIESKLDSESVLEQVQPEKKTRHGNELRCSCPVHQGDGENFSINLDTRKWQCFSHGCKGTNLIDLYAQSKRVDLPTAAKELAGYYGIQVRYKGSTDAPLPKKSEKMKKEIPKPEKKPTTQSVGKYSKEDVLKSWEQASEKDRDTYFSGKGLKPPPIARFGENPSGYHSTLIPYKDIRGELSFLLSLSKDGKFNFKAEDDAKGAFALLGHLEAADAFYIGEGIATVQTAWEASERQIPAVSCGSWKNMLPVVDAIKGKYPKARPIVLIDCDEGGNGLKAAESVFLKHPEATFRKPNFEWMPNGYEATDFNDLISKCGQGMDEVKKQLAIEYKMTETITEPLKEESKIFPIVPISERLNLHNEYLQKHRGKKYLGLRVKTLTEINENLKGLRKLILMAAAPNVGKTALTVQIATEVLQAQENACLVFVSLEMTEEEIFTRMNLYLSGLNFDTYVMGSKRMESDDSTLICFSEEELGKIRRAHEEVDRIGDRLQIIDASAKDKITADNIIKYIERLKKQTKCDRVIVVVDYLQVWPTPESKRFSSDLEADKWRIDEIKKIRDAINKENEDPIIVISEARKPPASEEIWGGDLADVMGSARSTYTPDGVMLLSQLTPKAIEKLWVQMKMPQIEKREFDSGGDAIISHLSQFGISICKLKFCKGRDGMNRFTLPVAFYFRKNTFGTINWHMIQKFMEG